MCLVACFIYLCVDVFVFVDCLLALFSLFGCLFGCLFVSSFICLLLFFVLCCLVV